MIEKKKTEAEAEHKPDFYSTPIDLYKSLVLTLAYIQPDSSSYKKKTKRKLRLSDLSRDRANLEP